MIMRLEEQGAVLGTSGFMIFGFWVGASAFFTLFGTVLAGTRLRFVHFLSITGYSLFGNVIALLASYILPFLWYLCFPLFSVGSALSMAWLFYERTPRQNWARAIAAVAIVTHVLFTLHLRRFARDAHVVFAPGPGP